jgi:hypothetical protein
MVFGRVATGRVATGRVLAGRVVARLCVGNRGQAALALVAKWKVVATSAP